MPESRPQPGSRRGLAPAPRLLLALLVFILLAPRPAAAQDLDLQITVFSTGAGPDQVAVAYSTPPPEVEMSRHWAILAKDLAIPPPKPRVTRDQGITVAEAELPGLANWTTGIVNLDPLVDAFKSYGHFRVMFFFMGKFPLASAESINKPPLRVQARVSGATVQYEVWVDQTGGPPKQLPRVRETGGTPLKVMLGIGVIALVVAVGVFLVLYVIMAHRRQAAASEGKP